MEKYKVVVEFSRDISVEFDAVMDKRDEESRIALLRLNELDLVDAPRGAVLIDLNLKKVVVVYDIMQVTSSIFFMKEAEGNYKVKCSTDMSFFDVYIVKADIWEDKGKSLFVSPEES